MIDVEKMKVGYNHPTNQYYPVNIFVCIVSVFVFLSYFTTALSHVSMSYFLIPFVDNDDEASQKSPAKPI